MATELELLFSKKAAEVTSEDVTKTVAALLAQRKNFAEVEAKKNAPKEPKPEKPPKAEKPVKEAKAQKAAPDLDGLTLEDLLGGG